MNEITYYSLRTIDSNDPKLNFLPTDAGEAALSKLHRALVVALGE